MEVLSRTMWITYFHGFSFRAHNQPSIVWPCIVNAPFCGGKNNTRLLERLLFFTITGSMCKGHGIAVLLLLHEQGKVEVTNATSEA